jgi:hypothetical protein
MIFREKSLILGAELFCFLKKSLSLQLLNSKFEIYMLKEILAVSGKPGLFRLVSKGKNLLVIESLTDKKRFPAYARDKVISLADISVYTTDDEVSIRKIFTAVKEKEAGKNISIDLVKSKPDELRAYFAEILPDFDRERVYASDIKKMLKWYDLLIAHGFTDFSEEEKPEIEETPEKEEVTEEKEEAKPKTTKTPTSAKVAAKHKDEPKSLVAKTTKAVKPKTTTKAAAPRKSTVGTKRGG